LLKVSSLTKSFGTRVILDRVSLELSRRDSALLLGPNGVGKTTLLNIIAGILNPDEGEIMIDDEVVFRGMANGKVEVYVPPAERLVGLVPEDYALYPHLTVEENIALPLKARGWSRQVIKNRVDYLITLFELGNYRNYKPHALSSGLKQRVAIARAISYEPKILLLDEPFKSVDPIFKQNIRRELREIISELDITVLMTTHDVEDINFYTDKVFVIINSQIRELSDLLIQNNEFKDVLGLSYVFLSPEELRSGCVSGLENIMSDLLITQDKSGFKHVLIIFKTDDIFLTKKRFMSNELLELHGVVRDIKASPEGYCLIISNCSQELRLPISKSYLKVNDFSVGDVVYAYLHKDLVKIRFMPS